MSDLSKTMASLEVVPTTPTRPPPTGLNILPSQSAEWTEYKVQEPKTPQSAVPPTDALRYPDTLNSVIEIRVSEAKGLGVFAINDIEPGTILLCEAPIVTLVDTGSRADPLDVAVNALSPIRKASFRSLHAYSRNKFESLNRSIVYSNGYSILNDLATGVFETASRINHSCVPNSQYVWKEGIGRMIFWNRTKLFKGEEVTVNYGHKKNYLKNIYGFECTCGACTDSELEVISSKSAGAEELPAVDGTIKDGVGVQVIAKNK